MAFDTENKRRSKASYYRRLLPIPDGTIDQGDRQHKIWKYRGISASTIVAVLGPYFIAARDAFVPGAVASDKWSAGSVADDSFSPGAATSEAK